MRLELKLEQKLELKLELKLKLKSKQIRQVKVQIEKGNKIPNRKGK